MTAPALPRPGALRASRAHALRRTGDEGFTLVEVVIAMVLLAIILSSVGVLYLGGMKHAEGLERRQVAVSLAQTAIEAARAVSAAPDSNSCVKLLQGRTQASVDSQWSAAPSGVTSVTDEAWMPTGCSGTLVLPLQGLPTGVGVATDPVVVAGQSYTVTTYIGTCVVDVTTNQCLRSTAVPGGTTTMYRIVARVTWSGTGCDTPSCAYSASTLVDASVDPVFNVRGASAPAAAADTVCLASGGAGTINIVANDTGALGTQPVTVVTNPTKGTLGPTIGTGIGSYTPNSGATGNDTFTYYDTDVNGLISSTVTVTITIGGC